MKDINTELLAKAIYETYCEGVGGLAFNGDMLPGWDEFAATTEKAKQVGAWRKAADAAVAYLLTAPQRDRLSFGDAVEAMKNGHAVARYIWPPNICAFINKGSDSHLSMHHPSSTVEHIRVDLFEQGAEGTVRRLPDVRMKLNSGSTMVGIGLSSADILAEDWMIVDVE